MPYFFLVLLSLASFNYLWQDEDAFFIDYAASHKRLSELGFLAPPCSAGKRLSRVTQSAVGIAVVISVAILVAVFLKVPYFKDPVY